MNLAKTTELLRRNMFGAVGAKVIIKTADYDTGRVLDALDKLNIVGQPLRRTKYITAWVPRFTLKYLTEVQNVEMLYLDAIARVPEIKGAFSDMGWRVRQMMERRPPSPSQLLDLITTQMDGWISTTETREQMEAHLADEIGISGNGVTLAIVDSDASERAANHPQLQGAVVNRANFTPSPTDECGHGGHCATIAVGRKAVSWPNGIEVQGVAPGAGLLLAKCLGTPMGMGQTSWIINAMDWSIEQGADIISMSLGGPIQNPDPQVDYIKEHIGDAIFVAAAGNDGPITTTINSPGHAPEVVTVGSMSILDRAVSAFSSRGPTPDGIVKPDVVAPGGGRNTMSSTPDENIYSGITYQTMLDREADRVGNGYTAIAGTSMATPHVAGFLALLLEGQLLGEERSGWAERFKQIMGAQKVKDNSVGWGLPRWSLFAEV